MLIDDDKLSILAGKCCELGHLYMYILSFKFHQKEWNTTCSEPTTYHSAWRFIQFIFEHIDTFLFTRGTNKNPFRCFISTLLSLWLQHLWVVVFFFNTNPGFSTLGSWVMFFLLASKSRFFHLKHVSPSQGKSVFPTHAETLFFSIPHQLVQVNILQGCMQNLYFKWVPQISWLIIIWYQDVNYSLLDLLDKPKHHIAELKHIRITNYHIHSYPHDIPSFTFDYMSMSQNPRTLPQNTSSWGKWMAIPPVIW